MGPFTETTQTSLRSAVHRPLNIRSSESITALQSARRTRTNTLYGALRQAIREKEFDLAYQPIIDLRTNRIVGAESLLRWRRGLEVISAGEFIEGLEESDLLDTVADWSIREACHRAAWIHRTLQQDFRMAVNVAPQQFVRGRLCGSVFEALQETDCNPQMLDLEITERTCLSNCDVVQAALGEFRARGIVVTIDDFGTGHANFTFLHSFPVTHLKIDKYYIRHMRGQNRVLKPIIEAAHRSGVLCTAEGIETEAQLRLVKSVGCDEAQGFYIARPMDFDSLTTALEEQVHSEAWEHACAS
jgi:EAL domain-containing protein (putative c-di-GMP-specific phosphodiesterase class I)